MSDIIIYEHPLNEKIRSYLRIEYLAQQIDRFRKLDSTAGFKPFFDCLFSLAELVDRGELKKELIKDLEEQEHHLTQWRDADNIDNVQLTILLDKIQSFSFHQSQPNKAQGLISGDQILHQIKNKLALPGGGCNFDTPLLYCWQQLPQEQRTSDIERWLQPFKMTIDAVELLLHMLRESVSYEEYVAIAGFYQATCEKNQLLRVKLSGHQGCYPNVSGYRNRFAIRFSALNGQQIHDIKFAISCC
ncbi:MAG: cell division protein ZapD [Gammaproteobacteria bacterium]|nr:cell division protein ZapD [Gammaproteobacteria bacterium]